jgi:hypothetical protein
MKAGRDNDPMPLDQLAQTAQDDDALSPIGPQPSLEDLPPESSGRIIRYIVTSTLEHGVAPTAVIALYADLSVYDLEETARERGLDLPAAWRRATGVAMAGQDALEQLARLAGVQNQSPQRERSIFDDPEDLDALEDDEQSFEQYYDRLTDRLPDLFDLATDAQQRIRRFAIEERLERGLPAVELLELYRGLENAGDLRAQQYLDRVFVDREIPSDWLDLQSEAGRVVDLAEARGRDAGKLFADLLRTSPGLEPLIALRLLIERLVYQQ